MKTSNKILFITGLVILVILLASVIGSRIFLNKFTSSYENGDINYSSIEKEYKDIEDFTSLDITGEWDITLTHGNTYKIFITGRSDSESPYKIEKKGTTLYLKENSQKELNRKLEVYITMPVITEVVSEGGIKLNITGFNENNLILNFTGGSWVNGKNCDFQNLNLTNAGAINLEFGNILTKNAHLQLAGAGNIVLNMNGGSISGSASGAMNIEYYGNAREEIQVAGLTSFGRKD